MPVANDAPVRLDAAVEQMLLHPVDRITRVRLVAMQAGMRDAAPSVDPLDPPSLAGRVLGAVMPRVGNPGVLRHGNSVRHLQRLSAWLDAVEGDPVLRDGGQRTVRQELQNLALLRRSRDRLIEG